MGDPLALHFYYVHRLFFSIKIKIGFNIVLAVALQETASQSNFFQQPAEANQNLNLYVHQG